MSIYVSACPFVLFHKIPKWLHVVQCANAVIIEGKSLILYLTKYIYYDP